MTRSPSVLRSALSLLSIRLILEQIGLALLVFALYALWLRVPDASAIDVIGSAFLALIVLAVAGGGESALILHLTGRPRTPVRLLRGTLLLLVGVVLWFAWTTLVDHLHADDYLRAGYLNSRLPHTMRNFFSFEHILLWLNWFWTALEWIGTAAITLFVFTAMVSTRPLRALPSALRCFTYWIAGVLGAIAATTCTNSLIEWTPGHGLRVELFSLVLRLSLVVFVDAAVLCLILAILATCVRRADALYSTPAGTPDESQPRTVDNP
jgi:hypothetical protein